MLQGYSVRKLNLETQAGSLADNREERMVWESVEWSRHQIETRAEEGPEQRGSAVSSRLGQVQGLIWWSVQRRGGSNKPCQVALFGIAPSVYLERSRKQRPHSSRSQVGTVSQFYPWELLGHFMDRTKRSVYRRAGLKEG